MGQPSFDQKKEKAASLKTLSDAIRAGYGFRKLVR
jgi:hypothetical protein